MEREFYLLPKAEKAKRVEGRAFDTLTVEEKLFVLYLKPNKKASDLALIKSLQKDLEVIQAQRIEEAKAPVIEREKVERDPVQLNTHQFRLFRDKAFKAFDSYKASVVYFGEIESEATRQAIETWYQTMKDFPVHITATTTLADYPVTPEGIKYYL